MLPTVDNDPTLAYVDLQGYKFHVRTYGDKSLPPVVVVHGGPGGDSKYLDALQGLAQSHHVVFYDQRGTGLSPRVNKEALTPKDEDDATVKDDTPPIKPRSPTRTTAM